MTELQTLKDIFLIVSIAINVFLFFLHNAQASICAIDIEEPKRGEKNSMNLSLRM
jgi:hypothetical protein